MIARRFRPPAARRRGVVLILVLSMLGLLAVIGVSFATFSGQARSAARAYTKKLSLPRADGLLDFAVRQLINDTTNPMSALYGHGLKRDMYGNDAIENGFYDRNPDGALLRIVNVESASTGPPLSWVVTTNIPRVVGFDFTRWILTIPGDAVDVSHTFEVNAWDVVAGNYRFTLTGGNQLASIPRDALTIGMVIPFNGAVFSLDGRYRHAFNGTGMAALTANVDRAMTGPIGSEYNDPGNRNPAQFANFRVSGSLLSGDFNYSYRPFNVNLLPMDEDYDAPDLENWFLAAQSADGRTVVPSFHRPGILVDHRNRDDTSDPRTRPFTDMTYPHPRNYTPGTVDHRNAVRAISRILRPRPVDHPTAGFSDLTPDPATGLIEYDVDNDGDGITDSVWVDIGYPVQRTDDGKLYKPLVSFMAVGLNGRMPLNTVGNLNARFPVDDPNTPNLDEAGQPLFDHASHLGTSPSEINPQYALQNTFDDFTNAGVNVSDQFKPVHQQFDNAVYTSPLHGTFRHVPVSLTQLRNLLTGTRRYEFPTAAIGEQNLVRVNSANEYFPNSVVDSVDVKDANNIVDRFNARTTAGRWGEPDAIPPQMVQLLYDPTIDPLLPEIDRGLNFSRDRVVVPSLGTPEDMPNPVRPGQSPYPGGRYLNDGIDNNLDTLDFFPPIAARGGNFSAEGPEAGRLTSAGVIGRRSDFPDPANTLLLASERIRRFVTPIDPVGIGRVTRYNQVPAFSWTGGPPGIVPFDIGPDGRGRISFMHYFRPPGVPLDIDDNSLADVPPNPARERLIPNTGGPQDPQYVLAQNRHNAFRGYEAFRNPGGDYGYLMGAMPYNISDAGVGFAPRNVAGVAAPPTDLFFNNGSNSEYVGTFNPLSLDVNSNPTGRLIRDPSVLPYFSANLYQSLPGPTSAVHTYPVGSPMFNDPNETNLYWPDVNDQPFGPRDLEWLYRYDDLDGASLESRLATLAPISFIHATDAQARRRMFSVETWDRTDATFAHDNPTPHYNLADPPRSRPGNYYDLSVLPGSQPFTPPYLAPADPARVDPSAGDVRQQVPQLNARFPGQFPDSRSASLADIGGTFQEGGNAANRRGWPAPAVAHGGQRINLNQPFPHSYNPREPVRQKWISETYQTLKLLLPPHAIDTPQELAKLGQFVVNLVDFRDPDNAITIWDNPDVRHLPGFRIDALDLDVPPSIHLAYHADGTVNPLYNGYDLNADGAIDAVNDVVSTALRHYGMEYQPVALTEVLGFQFSFAEETGPSTYQDARANRLFIELTNTLSQAGNPTPAATDLDMQGWDFVLVKEDYSPATSYAAGAPYFHPVHVRPDPITGQIPASRLPAPVNAPFVPDGATAPVDAQWRGQAVLLATGEAPDRSNVTNYWQSYRNSALPAANLVKAIQPNGNVDRFVLGGLRTDGPTPLATPDFEASGPNAPPRNNVALEFARDDWDLIPPVNDPELADYATNPQGRYYWLYLRRPANPLLPPDPVLNPMVVVDSIRFPFSTSDGTGRVNATSEDEVATASRQPIYSIQRPQPYRGGQLVPDPEDNARPLFIYGSSEQARPADGSSHSSLYQTVFDTPNPDSGGNTVITTRRIFERLGSRNDASGSGPNRESWDYLPFNDRDFMSVAELLMVPTSPPGLFTKQFAERPPTLLAAPIPSDTTGDGLSDQLGAFSPWPPVRPSGGDRYDHVPVELNPGASPPPPPGMSAPIIHAQVRTYPYLAHEFFYSSDPAAVIDPSNVLGLTDPLGNPIGPTFHAVGGPTGAGWHRMLEAFEVPSPVMDAIGPVSQGVNFDWFRQDRRPGLLNLNLVLDEEVFFGLLDDPRLLNATNLQQSLVASGAELPQVVTQVDLLGRPLASYPMAGRGFTVFSTDAAGSNLAGVPNSSHFPWMQMKRSFSDFLKQRHGGSEFLFAFSDGPTGTRGQAGPPLPRVARDRPYRSLSYYDIQRTLLRPATMEPSDFTTPPFGLIRGTGVVRAQDPGLKDSQYDISDGGVAVDPGLIYQPPNTVATATDVAAFYANPERTTPAGLKPIVPPIPPRRLFQVPDWADPNDRNTASNASVSAVDPVIMVGQTTEYTPITNANTALSSIVPPAFIGNYAGLFPLWTLNNPTNVADPRNFDQPTAIEMRDPNSGASAYLGGSVVGDVFTQPNPVDYLDTTYTVNSPSGAGTAVVDRDMRRHPSYRTEILQKLSNLTTPRTHQYAVWVTVGLFEVVRPGNRAQFEPDELGPELGAASGGNVRFRAFYVLDRSKATGFNPLRPGDYRDVITYRRRIE